MVVVGCDGGGLLLYRTVFLSISAIVDMYLKLCKGYSLGCGDILYSNPC